MVDNAEAQKLEDTHTVLRSPSGDARTFDIYLELAEMTAEMEERKVILSLESSDRGLEMILQT